MTSPVFAATAVAFSVALLLGYAITSSLLSSLPRQFAWVFAPAVGLSVCSTIFFFFRRPFFTVEFAVAAAALLYLYKRRHGKVPVPSASRLSALSFILCGAAGLAMGAVALRVDRAPHGDWDGFAIWNTHARFLFRDGADWRNGIQYSFHNDYPLLTPALAARFWRYTRVEVPDLGAIVGVTLALSGVAALAFALGELRGHSIGALFGLVLLGTPFYLYHATSQYADLPLGFFILSTIVLLCLYEHRGDGRILGLAGLTAGYAGWTKNEGLLFIAAACVALLMPRSGKKTRERFLPFLYGLALPLFTIFAFKATILGSNDLIAAQQDTISKMLDPGRHALIAQSFIAVLRSFGRWTVSPLIPLLLLILFQGIEGKAVRSFGWSTGAVMVGLVLAGYYGVYVVTPIELQVHLDTSLERLILHLWPSLLFLAGLLCHTDAKNARSAAQNSM